MAISKRCGGWEVRHRGARANTLFELADTHLDWREHNDKPIGPRAVQRLPDALRDHSAGR